MLKVFAYLSKKPGLETQAFIDYYENHHVPLVLSLAPAPPVYKRNYVVRGAGLNHHEDAIDFDVVTELVFADRAAFDDWIAKLGVEAIAGRGAVPRSVADEGMRNRGAHRVGLT